uniref:Uncharacterized protein n=1 Tax=Zea mays TaxID=4577 RepID=A0A804NG77_MAIZE
MLPSYYILGTKPRVRSQQHSTPSTILDRRLQRTLCFRLFVHERPSSRVLLVSALEASLDHAGSSRISGQCRPPSLGLGAQAVRLRGPAPRLAALPQPRLRRRRRRRRRRAVPLLLAVQPQLRLLLAVAARHLLHHLALTVLLLLPRRRLRLRRRRRRRRRHGPQAPARPPRAAVPGGGRPLRALPRPPRRRRGRGGGAPPRERRAPRRQRRPHAPPRAPQRHWQAGRRRRDRRRGPPAALRGAEGRQGARSREACRAAQEHFRPLQRLPQDEPAATGTGPRHAGRRQPQASRVEPDHQPKLARVQGQWRRQEKRGTQGASHGGRRGAGGVQPGHVKDGAVQQVGGDGGVPLRRPVPVRSRRRRAPPCHPPSALQDPGLPHGPRRRGLPLRPPLPLPPYAHPRRTPPPAPPLTKPGTRQGTAKGSLPQRWNRWFLFHLKSSQVCVSHENV